MATPAVSHQVIWCNQCRDASEKRAEPVRAAALQCGHSVEARYKGRYAYCEPCSMSRKRCWMCGNEVSPHGERRA